MRSIKTISIWLVLYMGLAGLAGATSPTKGTLSHLDRQKIMELLTHEEKTWLLQHKTIRIAGPKAFPPFQYYEPDGQLKGMSLDYINLIFSCLGVEPIIQIDLEWDQVLKEAKEKKTDLISCSAKTMERETYLLFTKPYLSFPLVIITRTDAPFLGGVGDLPGKKVTFIKGNASYDWIMRDEVNIVPYFVKTPLDGLKAVSLGHAQAHIDNLATATYLIQKQGLANLKIAAPVFNENYNLYMAVRKDWPELVSIINKIFAVITPQQHSTIRNRFLSIKYEYGIRKSDVMKWTLGISCVSIIILAVILMWNRRLTREIQERRRVEEDLKKSEKNYRSTLNSLHIGIVVHARDSGIQFSNPEAEKILGLTYEQIAEQKSNDPVWKLIHEDLSIIKIEDHPLNKVFSTKKPVENHILGIVRPDKNFITWLMVNAIPVFLNTGELEKTIINFVDITALKQAEKEKIQAQKIAEEHKKLALVGQIAGKMAHDFNNILGIIMGNAELALLKCNDLKIKKILGLIFEQTLRGKNLTKDLVVFAKDQEPKQEFFSISKKISLVLNLLKKDLEGIELIRENEPEVPDLLADPGMIEHALVNLIQNSIHATSMTKHPKIILRTYCVDESIFFEIEDNGCGIMEEYLETIYEPSFTMKGSRDLHGSYEAGIKGTGYGMANVKRYIQQHKGNISVESKFGSGTKFTICLPVIKKELTNEEKTELKQSICHFEKNILIVEDEPDISEIQYGVLTQDPCYHKIDIAENGQSAIELLKKNEYDLITMDYMLPGKINGMDVYDHIRTTNKTIPIVFISGNIEFIESIKELKQKDPWIAHLSKPCRNKDYVNCINELLEKRC